MQMSLVCVMMNTSHIKALSNKERSRHHERKKDGIAKDVSCILERANEQTENTYINMWTHLETQNMCMPGD